MSKNKLQHVVYECKYHIVLVPKYRFKIFTKDVKIAVKDEIKNNTFYNSKYLYNYLVRK
ncbi:MAG TPA: transposase [Spirochaetota bacterium]|mgnify:CR=1 FL=1|nr:transposase [Spirochaetota bacterium]